ncbi:MAG: chorismate lyase [Candidatus Thiodiazotropha taylori]
MSQRSSKRSLLEPHWSDWSQRRYSGVPPEAQAWLRDTGSLTRRVIQCCGSGRFRVSLQQQQWGRPLTSERQSLQMRQGLLALVRDVVLLCDDSPWVFARTLIPASTLKGPARRLMLLGEKPLGAVLFSDPKVIRGATMFARLSPGHALFDAACEHLQRQPELLWGRRTLFHMAQRPILVNELFLPELPMRLRGDR